MNHDVLFFIVVALAIGGQGLDIITTSAGLAHNAKETSGVVAWAIKKLSLPVVALVKVAGFGIGAPVLFYSLNHLGVGVFVASAAATAGFVAGIINYRRLKAAKIAVF